ncbi:hypothetical protein [Actinoplanes sp. NBRC 101535]|uniref:hypothetical protein n=1 Tax=Actinoplanes sp. NBRC 101535 TaxID=3032196 RepID=UPI0024A47E62|nr:hypothetical protein [Actinoplanes sp. NBRC 101535]GLY00926.1 hypothetical protein Acsp01_13050 [Actinoplanes sp. NBRC 101535]
MLDVPAGTDWSTRNVDQMWAMLERHDGSGHRRVLVGWRRSAELAQQHLAGALRYREALVAVWPPRGNRAAAAYIERLDALIASLRETSEAALTGHRLLGAVTVALESVRRELAGIHREHTANRVALAAFEEAKQLAMSGPGKALGPPPRSPVEPGRQAELTRRARVLMSGLCRELAEAQAALVTPGGYRAGGPTAAPAPAAGPGPAVTPGTRTAIGDDGSRPAAATTPNGESRAPDPRLIPAAGIAAAAISAAVFPATAGMTADNAVSRGDTAGRTTVRRTFPVNGIIGSGPAQAGSRTRSGPAGSQPVAAQAGTEPHAGSGAQAGQPGPGPAAQSAPAGPESRFGRIAAEPLPPHRVVPAGGVIGATPTARPAVPRVMSAGDRPGNRAAPRPARRGPVITADRDHPIDPGPVIGAEKP